MIESRTPLTHFHLRELETDAGATSADEGHPIQTSITCHSIKLSGKPGLTDENRLQVYAPQRFSPVGEQAIAPASIRTSRDPKAPELYCSQGEKQTPSCSWVYVSPVPSGRRSFELALKEEEQHLGEPYPDVC